MESDPRLATVPAGRLVCIQDIAEMLGVKRDTVDLWKARDKEGRKLAAPMPTPVLGKGSNRVRENIAFPLYDRDEIIAWANATGRLRPRS